MTRPPRRPSIELLRLPVPPPRRRLAALPGAWPPPPPPAPPELDQMNAVAHELARAGLV